MASRAVGLNHVSVVAHDLVESVRFYRELFGMEEIPTPDFGFPVQWLRLGDLQLHLFERPDGPPIYAHLALAVDDVVALVDEARRRGILDATTFGYAVAELPGGEAQVYLRDPAGNLVEVDHPDGAAARERIPEMIVFAERRPQPAGPVPRLFPERGRRPNVPGFSQARKLDRLVPGFSQAPSSAGYAGRPSSSHGMDAPVSPGAAR